MPYLIALAQKYEDEKSLWEASVVLVQAALAMLETCDVQQVSLHLEVIAEVVDLYCRAFFILEMCLLQVEGDMKVRVSTLYAYSGWQVLRHGLDRQITDKDGKIHTPTTMMVQITELSKDEKALDAMNVIGFGPLLPFINQLQFIAYVRCL